MNIIIKSQLLGCFCLGLLVIGGCEKKEVSSSPQDSAVIEEAVDRILLERKFQETLKKAEENDVEAQFKLGRMYQNGDGTYPNIQKAVHWYQKAAASGSIDAQAVLGGLYKTGTGVEQNIPKALALTKKAAAAGNSSAQTNLGFMFYTGTGVEKDTSEAIAWFKKAASQGDKDAQAALGLAYYLGTEVPKSLDLAYAFFKKAADQGQALAEYGLASMYSDGEGVPRDDEKAAAYFKSAAEKGYRPAQVNLGINYAAGIGVPKDLVLAYAWLNIGATDGENNAIQARKQVERSLTPAEIAEAQRLSSNWTTGNSITREGRSEPQTTPQTSARAKVRAGTAFYINKNGQAITNYHVVNGCSELRLADGSSAKVTSSDQFNDLAAIQSTSINSNAARLNFDPKKVRQGEDIAVFGYPLNSLLSSGGNLTPGVISALTGLANNSNQIQITAPIQPGSSGSPVLNKHGEVIAVVAQKLSDTKMAQATGSIGQNVNFAVSGQTLKAFLEANNLKHTTSLFRIFSKNNADLADEARKWTTVVECWN